MKYSSAIFDLDGTILNTLDDLADSTNAALEMNNLPRRTVDEVRLFVGNGIRLLIERAVPAGTEPSLVDRVFEDFKTYYGGHCSVKTGAYKGIPELLTALRKGGCKVAVVSNKADFAVRRLCDEYFPNCFDFAVGERQGVRRKPAPDSVLEALRALGENADGAVYIGDSDVDIETAANAGLPCISVLWGFRDADFLKAHGAVCFAESPERLGELLL